MWSIERQKRTVFGLGRCQGGGVTVEMRLEIELGVQGKQTGHGILGRGN